MKINILTHNNHFGCGIDSCLTLDIKIISKILVNNNIEVEVIEYDELLISGIKSNEYYWVASSKNETIKAYVDDIILGLFYGSFRKNLLINIDLIRAYENKGYQVILAKRLHLEMPNQRYITDFNLKHAYLGNSEAVIKRIGGSGSKGVAKIKVKNNGKDIKSFLRHSNIYFSSLNEWGYFFKEKIRQLLNKNYAEKRLKHFRPSTRFVSQEFIKNLKYDRKVLVFFDKIYVLKRNISKGDFRASGSGLFEFEKSISDDILDFCYNFREKLGAPYVSLDVINNEGQLNVIEFQCMNFGPYTKMNAPYFYIKENNGWLQKENNTSLEEDYTESIIRFIKQNNN